MRSPKPNARAIIEPQASAFRLSFGDFEAFSPPQTLNPLVVDYPSFPAKHFRDTTVSITSILSRKPDHVRHKDSFIVRYIRFAALSRAWLAQHLAGPTLRDALMAKLLTYMCHRTTTLCWA